MAVPTTDEVDDDKPAEDTARGSIEEFARLVLGEGTLPPYQSEMLRIMQNGEKVARLTIPYQRLAATMQRLIEEMAKNHEQVHRIMGLDQWTRTSLDEEGNPVTVAIDPSTIYIGLDPASPDGDKTVHHEIRGKDLGLIFIDDPIEDSSGTVETSMLMFSETFELRPLRMSRVELYDAKPVVSVEMSSMPHWQKLNGAGKPWKRKR